jgi:hypothetical protein
MGEGLPLNVRRILDLSIEAPRKTYTSNDFAPLKMFTADSNINGAINFLRKGRYSLNLKRSARDLRKEDHRNLSSYPIILKHLTNCMKIFRRGIISKRTWDPNMSIM